MKILHFLFIFSFLFANADNLSPKKLKIAFGANKAPFVFELGSNKGFECEIVKEIFKPYGYEVEPILYTNNQLQNLLNKDFTIDAATGVQDYGKDSFFYSKNYILFDNYAFTRKNDNITLNSYDDLKGKKVAIWGGGYKHLDKKFYSMFNPKARKKHSPQFYEINNQTEQVKAFFTEDVDVAILDKTIMYWEKNKLSKDINTDINIEAHKLFKGNTGFKTAFRDEKLKNIFNEGLEKLKKSRRYQQIINKYLDKNYLFYKEFSEEFTNIIKPYIFEENTNVTKTLMNNFISKFKYIKKVNLYNRYDDIIARYTNNKTLDASIYNLTTPIYISNQYDGKVEKLGKLEIFFYSAKENENTLNFKNTINSIDTLSNIDKGILLNNLNKINNNSIFYLTKKQKEYIKNNTFNLYVVNWGSLQIIDKNSKEAVKVKGYNIDYWNYIVKQTGIKFNYKYENSFADILEKMKNDPNGITFGTSKTKEKEEYSSFTKPHTYYPITIVTNEDKPFLVDLNSLSDKTIAVGKSYTAYKLLKKHYPNINFVLTKNTEEALNLVARDKAYGAADILPVIVDKMNHTNYSNLKIAGNSEFKVDLRTMVNSNAKELIPILNKVFETIPSDVKKDMEQKWINATRIVKIKDYTHNLWILGILVFILILFIIRQRIIDKEKEKFQLLLKNATDGIHILDTNGNIIDCSDSFAKTLGYSLNEAKKLNVTDWNIGIPKEDLIDTVKDLIQNPVTFETTQKRKDGSLVDVQISTKGINLNGKVVLYCSQRDITKQKEMEEQLKSEKNKLSKSLEDINKISNEQQILLSLFDKSDSVLFKWKNNFAWDVEYVSSSVGKLLDYKKETFLSQEISYSSCIYKEDANKVFEEVKEAIENNKDFFKHDPYRVVTKDGRIKWVLDYTVTQKDENGKIKYFIGYISDITDQKNIEEQLKIAKQTADKANEAKSEFLANMSHEIRTPLNGTIGLTDIVLDTNLTDMQKEYLQKAQSSSRSLLHIINDILDYSKIEAGKLDIVKDKFYLDELLQNITHIYGYKIYEKGLELNYTVDPDINNSLIGDNLRITQVLTNFIGNAIKFTSEGFIHVDIKQKEQKNNKTILEFSVKDSGIGIAKDNQEKLFKAFSQEDASTTKKFGGTGLGLAISKQLIEMMGGKIFFESEKGVGSKFGFELEFEYEDDQNFLTSNHFFKDHHFLVIDDNKIDREYLVAILASWGINAIQAKDGLEAYNVLKDESVDYLLVDWKMPNLDGLELLEKLQDENIKIPHILMITAHNKNELLNKAKQNDIFVEKVLEKPYTPSSIYNLLFDNERIQTVYHNKNFTLKLRNKEKALLVEDNETNQIVATKILENIGFEIEIANDGIEAVSKASQDEYKIIFMDLQMPNMDGFEASKKIREFNQTTPIVALSAAVMQKDKEMTKEAGMNDHLAKPIDKDELFNVIQNYFETKVESLKTKKDENQLIDIENIDMQRVLKDTNMEVENLYSMYLEFAKDFGEIKSDLNPYELDSLEFKKYIHKLKGASGNLKINKVFELTKKIHDESKLQFVEPLLESTTNVCKEIKNKLSHLAKKDIDTNIDLNELKQMIEKMIEELDDYEYIESNRKNELLNIIKTKVSDDLFQPLIGSFEDGDNEIMVEQLNNILDNL